ncbi:hypothetical protein [Desulforhabdus sp. TSK]|uniref:hypothetical protein n=1 Tax=Desulforhabdus sp. TSK TaxID=2925014 RepID=UPI001FC82F87|nr:hypothetical protein [Desulforhabdus sp. TSK]
MGFFIYGIKHKSSRLCWLKVQVHRGPPKNSRENEQESLFLFFANLQTTGHSVKEQGPGLIEKGQSVAKHFGGGS